MPELISKDNKALNTTILLLPAYYKSIPQITKDKKNTDLYTTITYSITKTKITLKLPRAKSLRYYIVVTWKLTERGTDIATECLHMLALCVELNDGVDGLQECGNKQDGSGNEGDEHPGVSQVGLHEASSPPVPALPAVCLELPLHVAQSIVIVRPVLSG